MTDDDLYCEQCDTQVDRQNAIRTETMGDLDSDKWQTLCCPSCGHRLIVSITSNSTIPRQIDREKPCRPVTQPTDRQTLVIDTMKTVFVRPVE